MSLPGICLAAAAALLCVPAHADVSPFQSPSGNIQCTLGEGFEGPADVECTIVERGGQPAAPALAACGAGTAHNFAMSERGSVQVSCVSAPRGRSLGAEVPYGVTATWGALACTSTRRGFECRNGDGHGFFLSRASQRVF